MTHPIHDIDLVTVIDRLCMAEGLIRRADRAHSSEPLPSLDAVIGVLQRIRTVLFPGYFGVAEVRPDSVRYHIGHALDEIHRALEIQIRRSIAFQGTDDGPSVADAERIAAEFIAELPNIQSVLADDVNAAYQGDPAATSADEAIFSYPGLRAVTKYRVAHALSDLGVPLLPRMITEYAHSVTGIDIHPGARVGRGIFIDHGTGVVIGETCRIGERVCIYQGVTLGAKSFPLDADGNPVKGIDRHPIIEDGVTIYAGATILGRVTIGAGSVIGGNVWLTRSVPADSRITIQPPRWEQFSDGAGI